MSLGAGVSGLTQQTPEYLVLDTGMMYANINVTELEKAGGGWSAATNEANTWTAANGQVVTPTPFGATRGGFTVDPQIAIEPIDVDGALSPVLGLDRTASFAPIISGEILELANQTTLRNALGAADITETASGLYKIKPRSGVQLSDYLGNIAILASTSNSNTSDLWVIVLDNPLGGIQAHQMQRGNANGIPVTFTGHSSLTSPYVIPITYYTPNTSGSGSGS